MYDTQSHLLAKRARQELQDSGTTTVICERCKRKPKNHYNAARRTDNCDLQMWICV